MPAITRRNRISSQHRNSSTWTAREPCCKLNGNHRSELMSATTDAGAGPAERPRVLLGESIAKNLILGEIVEENLFPYPAIRSRDCEMLGQIVEAIDAFLADKAADFRRWDREGAQPAEFIQSLRELGLFSLIIPEEFGGLALSNAAYARVLAQTSSYDSSVSLTIGAHSSIGDRKSVV